MDSVVLTIMEIIGTVAFSISGALVGISAGLDIFGVVFLGIVTSVGGGMLRDVLIGNLPPLIFSNQHIFIIAAAVALFVFVIAYINKLRFNVIKEKLERVNNVFDAVGLSAFTVAGTEIAILSGTSGGIIFAVVMGMLTGCGGGVFRDVLVSHTPYILKKHIYALASICGSIIYYLLVVYINKNTVATVAAISFIFLVRMVATKFRWKLPKIILTEEKEK